MSEFPDDVIRTILKGEFVGAAPSQESVKTDKTPKMHTAVRKVLKHHKLSEGSGVIEADLIYAVLDLVESDVATQIADQKRLNEICLADNERLTLFVRQAEHTKYYQDELQMNLQLREQIAKLEAKVDRLEWENKGIAEWRDIANEMQDRINELNGYIRHNLNSKTLTNVSNFELEQELTRRGYTFKNKEIL